MTAENEAVDLQAPGAIEQILTPGTRLRQYELIRPLASGGMGIVYLARDTKLGRRVAIKFVRTASREVAEAFVAEARTTAACEHDNIVVIHEVDEFKGIPYIVLELLEGASLRELMTGPMSVQRTLEIAIPVVRALDRAHESHIVHRDLKPENVFVTTRGSIKVLDFGIASLASKPVKAATATAGPAPANLSDTNTGGSTVGTLPYLAPELFDEPASDPRGDLWALGIMLYEMLAGHHPVQPLDSVMLTENAIALDVPMPSLLDAAPTVPPRLAALVAACLEKRRDKRIANARAVLAELEALLPSRVQRTYGEDETPYPGLVAFQEKEADRFFGRERDIQQVVARLREQPLGAIIGPPGVGKSSFVRAGLIPALKTSGEHWEAIILRPGRRPLQSLAALIQPLSLTPVEPLAETLADHSTMIARLRHEPGYVGSVLRARAAERSQRYLVFVDQFEELYTLVPDAEERHAFVTCLLGIADDRSAPVRVLLSLRSDFLDRVGEDKLFAEELGRGLVLMQPLGPDGLRAAFKGPTEQLGYAFETAEMVDDMVSALANTPGALSLLQFAGAKLWETRDVRRKLLTDSSYRALGGIAGAMAQHADQVVNALPSATQRLIRALFQRLVTPEGTRAIVDVQDLTELSPDATEVRSLIDRLVQERLLVVQASGTEQTTTVELVHESLITSWPLLRRWLDEGRDDVVFRQHLREAAKQWHARNRPQGLLWRGEAMDEARLWRARHADVLPAKEQEFLHAVFLLATRAQRVRRAIVIGTIAVLSLVIAGGAVALVEIRQAQQLAV